jgi:hypothetical protein
MFKYTGGNERGEGGEGGGGRRGRGSGGGVGRGSRAPPSYYHPGQAARGMEQKFFKKTILCTDIGIGIITSCCQLNTAIMATLIKKKIKFSSYIRKFIGIGC